MLLAVSILAVDLLLSRALLLVDRSMLGLPTRCRTAPLISQTGNRTTKRCVSMHRSIGYRTLSHLLYETRLGSACFLPQVFAQFGVTVFRVFLVRIPLRLALSVMGIKLEEKHADLRRLGLRCVRRLARDGHGPVGGRVLVGLGSCRFVLHVQDRTLHGTPPRGFSV